MKKYLITLAIGILVGFLFLSCDKDCPECPECPECPATLECPEDHLMVKEPLKWECLPNITPPPPPNCDRLITMTGAGDPATGDYTQNCDGATDRLWNLCIQRQEMVWKGMRSPGYVASQCPDKVGEIGTTVEELRELEAAGGDFVQQMDRFYSRLQIEDEECPGRTVVNRGIYDTFQDEREEHIKKIEEIDNNAQAHECRSTCGYDTMQGFCKCFVDGKCN